MGDPFEVLGAFSRRLARESHNVLTQPRLLWQQMYNRLQWDGEAVREVLAPQLAGRSSPDAAPWVRTRTPFRESRALVRVFAQRDWVMDCAFSSDGTFIASAGWGGTLKVWDAHTGRALTTISVGATLEACAISPDNAQVLAGWTRPGTPLTARMGVWDLRSGALIREFGVEEDLQSHGSRQFGTCVFNPRGGGIVSADKDTLRTWDLETGRRRVEFDGFVSLSPRSCTVSPDGSYLVVASHREAFAVLDAETGALLASFHDDALDSSGGFWQSVKEVLLAGLGRWGSRSSGSEPVERVYPQGRVLACAVSPDGRRVASAHADGALKLWDVEAGRRLWTVPGHSGDVRDCAVSPDGTLIASAGDSTVRIWDASTGTARAELHGHSDSVECCCFSPDGRMVVSGARDGTLRLWDLQQAGAAAPAHAHGDMVWDCSYSPDGGLVASACGDGTVAIWDGDTGEVRSVLHGDAGHAHACAFSPGGAQLVVCYDQTLVVWDVASGLPVKTLPGHTESAMDCAVDPNGAFVVSAGWEREPQVGTLKIWDLETGSERARFVVGQEGVACAASPDGALVGAAGGLGDLKVWEVRTGRLLRTFPHGHDALNDCAFSPDGTSIASASADGTVKVWDLAEGRLLARFRGSSCAFTPDGSFVASVDRQGVCRLWDVQKRSVRVTLPVPGGSARIALHPFLPKAAVFAGKTRVNLYLVNFEGLRYLPIARNTSQQAKAW